MKKKILILAILSLVLMPISGCGKKNNNLSNEINNSNDKTTEESQNNENPMYVYALKKISNAQDGNMTRPGKNIYFKYTLIDNKIAIGTVPEVCVYSEQNDKELCLKNNEYEISKEKIKNYFGFDENTWSNSGVTGWRAPGKNIFCDITDESIYCSGDISGTLLDAVAYSEGSVGGRDYVADMNCNIHSNDEILCY